MASEMTSAFRDFALKKLQEAREKGATLANVTAATAASLTSGVPVTATGAGFVFRSKATATNARGDTPAAELPLDKKLTMLAGANAALRKCASDHPPETLDGAIYKIDLINESLAFTIENIQECAHSMTLLQRQFRELGALRSSTDEDRAFYRRRPMASPSPASTSDDPPTEPSDTA